MSEEQVVVFRVGGEECAIPVSQTKEIIQYFETTRLPNTPPHLKGIINVRGQIIPVISLAAKFGLVDNQEGKGKVIIVEIGCQEIGVIVDEVTEVYNLSSASIDPPPNIGSGYSGAIKGIGKAGDRLLILLNLEQLIGGDELSLGNN